MRDNSWMDGSADSAKYCRPAKASRTHSPSSSPRARARSSATALSTLTKRLSMRTPVWTRWTGSGVLGLMAFPLLVLPLKLGIGDGRRALQGFDRRAKVLCGAPDYAEWVGPTLANCLKRRVDLLFLCWPYSA